MLPEYDADTDFSAEISDVEYVPGNKKNVKTTLLSQHQTETTKTQKFAILRFFSGNMEC